MFENFYAAQGLQDGVVTAIFLLSFAYCLAPWVGGAQLGVMTVPKLADVHRKKHAVAGFFLFTSVLAGFMPIWEVRSSTPLPPSPVEPTDIDELARLTEDAFRMEDEAENHFTAVITRVDMTRSECSERFSAAQSLLKSFSAREIVRGYRNVMEAEGPTSERRESLLRMDQQARVSQLNTIQSMDAIAQDLSARNCFVVQ